MPNPDKELFSTPTISRVFPDGTLVEILYDSEAATTSLAVCLPNGEISIVPHDDLPTGERLVPYSPRNQLITSGTVSLPSAVGEALGKTELIEDIRAFIHRYVDLSPVFEEIATHYVLLTWVYDAFNELPYLRFRGDYGTGKTRALLTLAAIVYKGFVASGASTVSPIFHILDAFGGALILDEADFRFSDATAELTKILNNGNMKGLPVLRTLTNRHRELNPTSFNVYGPKIIAMREGFGDRALESRFLTEETSGRALRTDIPINFPDAHKAEALALRNKLLAWRFRNRHLVGPDPSRLIEGVAPRVNQIAMALLSIVDDEGVRSRIAAELVLDEARVLNERAASLEATMLKAIMDALTGANAPYATLADITNRFNQAACQDLGHPVSNKWVGTFVRNRLRIQPIKSRGVYVIPQTEAKKITELARRHGIDRETETNPA